MISTLLRISSTVLAGFVAVLGACSQTTVTCQDSSSCVRDSSDHGGTLQGMCEATGYCSFPDATCVASSRRYDASATETLADMCVPANPAGDCVAQITGGGQHTCVLEQVGGQGSSIWCWGANSSGQLGNGTFTDSAVPVQVPLASFGLAANDHLAAVTAGSEHTCALTARGQVYCWGSNASGQLGVVENFHVPPPPLVPIGNSNVPRHVEFDDPLDVAVQLAAGASYTCATTVDGHAHCWGANGYGQLGDDTTMSSPTPGEIVVPIAKEIVPGGQHTCILTQDGRLFCVGSNQFGQLGAGSHLRDSLSPVQINAIPSAVHVVAGQQHTCVIRADQSVWCWGNNMFGSVGSGDADAPVFEPAEVFSATTVVTGSSAFHTCALTGDHGGELWCWGADDTGEIGVPPQAATDGVVNVPTRAVISTVTSRIAIGGAHTCAVTYDGTLWCWGNDDAGQLGNGTVGDSTFVPQAVDICGT
jgi:alpha-tubulin suppressor-like RCC1 family protein